MHNIKVHLATSWSLFEIIHGYQPVLFPEWDEKTPKGDLQEIWKETQASLEMVAEKMKYYHD